MPNQISSENFVQAVSIPDEDFEAIFRYEGNIGDRSRFSMRFSRLNRLAKNYQTVLYRNQEDAQVIFQAPSLDLLSDFSKSLLNSRGILRKTLGQYLFSRINGFSDPDAPLKAFARKQIRHITTLFLEPRLLPTVNFSSLWVNPPYGIYGKDIPSTDNLKNLPDLIIGKLFKEDPKSIFLTGDAGAGKTASLFRVFSKLADKDAWELFPIFIPASSLCFEEGKFWIAWDSVPGGPVLDSERLEGLFYEGKLILFLDALDEKLESVDFANPRVAAFWRAASKNRCVISCREQFAGIYIKGNYLKDIFLNNIIFLKLFDWNGSHIKQFYSRLAPNFKKTGFRRHHGILRRLSLLSMQALEEKIPWKRNAWNIWMYAFGCIYGGDNGSVENKYNSMELISSRILEWETVKPGTIFCGETTQGLLAHLAWHIYKESVGKEYWVISLEDVWRLAVRHYPFFEGRQAQFFASLGRIPFLTYDGVAGAYIFDPRFAEFYVAKRVLSMRGARNKAILKELHEVKLSDSIKGYLEEAESARCWPRTSQRQSGKVPQNPLF